LLGEPRDFSNSVFINTVILSAMLIRVLAVLFCLSTLLQAQCDLEWRSAGGYPGANGIAYAACVWDPDGPGPMQERAVVGGDFTVLGEASASRIAVYNPAIGKWSSLGSGMNGRVSMLVAAPNGDLFAGGSFTVAGGVAAASIARWDGSSWHPLSSGVSGSVLAGAVLPNGDLVIGGQFTSAGGVATQNVAQWNGASFSPLGSGANASVLTLRAAPNGDLFAAGEFTLVGGLSVQRVARWGSGAWSALGSGCDAQVRALVVLPNGDLVAAGAFTVAGAVPAAGVARWSDGQWSAMTNGVGALQFGQSLELLPNGNPVLGTQGFSSVYEWTGLGWSSRVSVAGGVLGPSGPSSSIKALAVLSTGVITFAGDFRTVTPGLNMPNVAQLGATGVVGAGQGLSAPVECVAPIPTGGVAARGAFTSYGATSLPGLAKWNGSDWQFAGPLNLASGGSSRRTVIPIDNDRMFVTGPFVETYTNPITGQTLAVYYEAGTTGLAGFTPVHNWLGLAVTDTVIAVKPNGDLVLCSSWWGTSVLNVFSNHGTGSSFQAPGTIQCLAAGNDRLVAGSGSIQPLPGYIASWDGTTWNPFGSGLSAPVRTVLISAGGDVFAGGDFVMAGGVLVNRVARWDGANWSPLGTGLDSVVLALAQLPNGDLLAGGYFTTAGGQPARHLARWDGTTWSEVAGGTNGPVWSICLSQEGEIWIGGNFTTAGGCGCGYVARLVSTCPAGVVSLGAGCVGSGGNNQLVATSLPWLDSAFTSKGTGLPPQGVAVGVAGIAPVSLPLTVIMPQAGVGCDLLAYPTLLDLQVPSNGSLTLHLSLPSAAVLVGQRIWQQVVALELDASANIVELTSSNALRLTVGKL
jgi:trimeric autotransporter adhesin